MKNSNDTIGNGTRDLPICSAVPQQTALPRYKTSGQPYALQYYRGRAVYSEHPILTSYYVFTSTQYRNPQLLAFLALRCTVMEFAVSCEECPA
jgi:hypothetical protein